MFHSTENKVLMGIPCWCFKF